MQKMKTKRLCVFAGPNGSGKSTLFEAFSKKHDIGYFINADLIENILKTKRFIDLESFNIKATQAELRSFFNKEEAHSLIKKSTESGYRIDVEIKENLIVNLSKNTHSYESALVAMFLREKLMENGDSFSFETVMSHPSKIKEIEEAQKMGYKTYLYFVCTDTPEINISRIENRIYKGGHPVNNEKVISRYSQTLENLFPAISACDRSYLFDNSGNELSLIAESSNGSIILQTDIQKSPNWFINYVLSY